MSTMLSKHFSLNELIASETARRMNIDNEPGQEEYENLLFLTHHILQPIRDALQRPVIITSGLRLPLLNRLLGGDPESYHIPGLAADIRVPGMAPSPLFHFILGMRLPAIEECILEFDHWVHVASRFPSATSAKHEYLIARRQHDEISYTAIA